MLFRSPNQTKEDGIGSLPEKEFRMIVKMIQNLENKMELQINRLETRIDENFNWGKIATLTILSLPIHEEDIALHSFTSLNSLSNALQICTDL